MPRPYKKGLDYFELDCYLDDKFGMIEAEFGSFTSLFTGSLVTIANGQMN